MAKRLQRMQKTAIPSQSPWWNSDWFLGLLLVLAVILVYQPVWYAGYIWDDDVHVTANRCIVGPLGLREIWTTSAGKFFPLTLTTFWVEHALWGSNPLPYHLLNVFLHGACAFLLWWVLCALRIPGAWLGAALWAVHPVQVESVAWITEMKNTQSCLFYLLSILFFLKWLEAQDGRAARGWAYVLTLVFAVLAMTSKSSTVILPVVLCLCAWWIEGRWHWRNLARTGPIFLMSIIVTVVSIWTQKQEGGVDPLLVQSWPQRVITAGDMVWFYLGKLFWPHPLIMVYPLWHIDAGQPFLYLSPLAVIVVLFVLWLYRGSWGRPWFFAFAYFLATLLPALGLVSNAFLNHSFVADHLQYLADMGPLALAGAGMVRFLDFVMLEKPWCQSTLCAGVLLILAGLSWRHVWIYENEETLWTVTLAQNPGCWIGYNNLGIALRKEGRVDDAIVQYQKALEIKPDYANACNNLGDALSQAGQLDEAIVQYEKALEINPNQANACNNLGNALKQKGRVDEAIAQFQKALAINPNFAEAHANLARALLQKGLVDQAMDQILTALKITPSFAEAHSILATCLKRKGRVDEAIAEYQKALEIDPSMAEAYNNMANILLEKGQVDEALVQLQKALEFNPNSAEIHNSTGAAYAQKGQLNEAISQFQDALRLKPNFVTAQQNLTAAQAAARQNPAQK